MIQTFSSNYNQTGNSPSEAPTEGGSLISKVQPSKFQHACSMTFQENWAHNDMNMFPDPSCFCQSKSSDYFYQLSAPMSSWSDSYEPFASVHFPECIFSPSWSTLPEVVISVPQGFKKRTYSFSCSICGHL